MSATTFGPYLYGDIPAPFILPSPWMWDFDPHNWLTAIGPGPLRYIATKDELYLVAETPDGYQLTENPPKNHRPKQDDIIPS